ncbi:MAG TPA: hypothetical protein VKR06_43930, partial [Ktedonosporobacter sp.]|nr:hypothetical protein [Ktedonosporobacter sp.]
MPVQPSTKLSTDLYAANTLESFWQPLIHPRISAEEWAAALQAAVSNLPKHARLAGLAPDGVIAAILGESLVGDHHWHLSRSKQLYYQIKPLLPRHLSILSRRRYRQRQETDFLLGWPIEESYVQLLFSCFADALRRRGLHTAPYLNFWPRGQRFALVLTHDVERAN